MLLAINPADENEEEELAGLPNERHHRSKWVKRVVATFTIGQLLRERNQVRP